MRSLFSIALSPQPILGKPLEFRLLLLPEYLLTWKVCHESWEGISLGRLPFECAKLNLYQHFGIESQQLRLYTSINFRSLTFNDEKTDQSSDQNAACTRFTNFLLVWNTNAFFTLFIKCQHKV